MGWFSKDIDGKDLFSHFVMTVGFVYFMDTKTFKKEFNTNTEEGFDHFKIFAPLLMDLTYGSLPRGVKATQEQELNVMFASQLVRNALFTDKNYGIKEHVIRFGELFEDSFGRFGTEDWKDPSVEEFRLRIESYGFKLHPESQFIQNIDKNKD